MNRDYAIQNRDYAIQVIEAFYPPDDQDEETAEIGQQLLEQAKADVAGWRTEPTAVLIRFAELCLARGDAT